MVHPRIRCPIVAAVAALGQATGSSAGGMVAVVLRIAGVAHCALVGAVGGCKRVAARSHAGIGMGWRHGMVLLMSMLLVLDLIWIGPDWSKLVAVMIVQLCSSRLTAIGRVLAGHNRRPAIAVILAMRMVWIWSMDPLIIVVCDTVRRRGTAITAAAAIDTLELEPFERSNFRRFHFLLHIVVGAGTSLPSPSPLALSKPVQSALIARLAARSGPEGRQTCITLGPLWLVLFGPPRQIAAGAITARVHLADSSYPRRVCCSYCVAAT